jgi:hypothetical protein
MTDPVCTEIKRLQEDEQRQANWKRWGPYLSERQWGTVREDYSEDGEAWRSFPHDRARSRAYRWGEDGLLGICDRQGRLCFALALWNGRDPILKERLIGLSGLEGNHGEDVKESYFYLDATPTSSYLKALYKYPQSAFPYSDLVDENRRRDRTQPEYELADTGAFHEQRYFDVTVEYAKATDSDVLIRIVVANRGPDAAPLHVLPTLWFRNTWSWGRSGEGYPERPGLRREGDTRVRTTHATLGEMLWDIDPAHGATLLFTENETRPSRSSTEGAQSYYKDAFHETVVHGRADAVNPSGVGTKAAAHCVLDVAPGKHVTLRLRLQAASDNAAAAFGPEFDHIFNLRIQEAQAFYESVLPRTSRVAERLVARQAYAGLLWSKQFYHYAVEQWLEGDPTYPTPPAARQNVRNRQWKHLYNRDVISMPDKWEYPWYAAWDVAFHMIPFARIDPHFAKQQLLLFLREWYMHPNGQLPAYEYGFGDVNPPVHAWSAWRVYKMTGQRGRRDQQFLARVFQKLLLNFTWWVNRKDAEGNNLFGGGFLGLDNIGVFDRSKGIPEGGRLEQADGTAWMAFYCGSMLSMAMELAKHDRTYSDMASKFFEHFVHIVDAMNSLGGTGLWSKQREQTIATFRDDPQRHVLLMSYGAGAVGLNLQFASYVFLFDRWWNPAVEDQAINRAHRIGAAGPVTVTRFLALGTIEERINQVLEEKRELFETILSNADTPKKLGLSQREIFGLFKLHTPDGPLDAAA